MLNHLILDNIWPIINPVLVIIKIWVFLMFLMSVAEDDVAFTTSSGNVLYWQRRMWRMPKDKQYKAITYASVYLIYLDFAQLNMHRFLVALITVSDTRCCCLNNPMCCISVSDGWTGSESPCHPGALCFWGANQYPLLPASTHHPPPLLQKTPSWIGRCVCQAVKDMTLLSSVPLNSLTYIWRIIQAPVVDHMCFDCWLLSHLWDLKSGC